MRTAQNCSDRESNQSIWHRSFRYGQAVRGSLQGSDGRHLASWYVCTSDGSRPLCARKGAAWNLPWHKRVALTPSIDTEGSNFAAAIEEAHDRVHAYYTYTADASVRLPAWLVAWRAERLELERAQREVAALLAARRPSTCVQSMPWFCADARHRTHDDPR